VQGYENQIDIIFYCTLSQKLGKLSSINFLSCMSRRPKNVEIFTALASSLCFHEEMQYNKHVLFYIHQIFFVKQLSKFFDDLVSQVKCDTVEIMYLIPKL
jgi:hypothetical protein